MNICHLPHICYPNTFQITVFSITRSSLRISPNPGNLDRLSIHPGRSMRVIATVIGPLKKHVGKYTISL